MIYTHNTQTSSNAAVVSVHDRYFTVTFDGHRVLTTRHAANPSVTWCLSTQILDRRCSPVQKPPAIQPDWVELKRTLYTYGRIKITHTHTHVRVWGSNPLVVNIIIIYIECRVIWYLTPPKKKTNTIIQCSRRGHFHFYCKTNCGGVAQFLSESYDKIKILRPSYVR